MSFAFWVASAVTVDLIIFLGLVHYSFSFRPGSGIPLATWVSIHVFVVTYAVASAA